MRHEMRSATTITVQQRHSTVERSGRTHPGAVATDPRQLVLHLDATIRLSVVVDGQSFGPR